MQLVNPVPNMNLHIHLIEPPTLVKFSLTYEVKNTFMLLNGFNCLHIALLTVFSARQLTVQMMQNPQILAALQERLDGLNGSPSGYMER